MFAPRLYKLVDRFLKEYILLVAQTKNKQCLPALYNMKLVSKKIL